VRFAYPGYKSGSTPWRTIPAIRRIDHAERHCPARAGDTINGTIDAPAVVKAEPP